MAKQQAPDGLEKLEARLLALGLLSESDGSDEVVVPLESRGVRLEWICRFLHACFEFDHAPVVEQHNEETEFRKWVLASRLQRMVEEGEIVDALDTKYHHFNAPPDTPALTFRDVVNAYVVPLTQAGKIPLYARVPAEFRAEPYVFVSHPWDNVAIGPMGRDGVIGSLVWRYGPKTPVWIDVVCYNQHQPSSVRFDMKRVIERCDYVSIVYSEHTPPFNRLWCLWEIACALELGKPISINCSFAWGANKYVGSELLETKWEATLEEDRMLIEELLKKRFGSVRSFRLFVRWIFRAWGEHRVGVRSGLDEILLRCDLFFLTKYRKVLPVFAALDRIHAGLLAKNRGGLGWVCG